MRLFALGLSSASLAITFNALAISARDAMPTGGFIVFALILLFGHGLNFALGIMSGVIHGLRLNLLEFYNWGIQDEGYAFKAFKKRGESPWNNS
jgi:V/A-type H+-transporting ATPase subunit I